MAYSFDEHKHRYAVWTAARAVQRSFAKTPDIENAINCTGLRQFSESEASITQDAYDTKQKEWCNLIIDHFSNLDKSPKSSSDPPEKYKCSYGRASKIIAIYLKTSITLPNKGQTENCSVIHPPIDRILLECLVDKKNIKELLERPWTQFEEKDYWRIVRIIRANDLTFDWTLEEYWHSHPKRKDWPEAFQEMAKNGDDKLITPDVFKDEELNDNPYF